LVKRLLDDGHEVKAVDVKSPGKWWQLDESAWNIADCDLSLREKAFDAVRGQDRVFNLAADMGGIGYIETHPADCMFSVLINTHLLKAAHWHRVKRYFYASSACVYHAAHQGDTGQDVLSLREEDVYDQDGGVAPEMGYGEEKWFSEQLCRRVAEDFGLEVRIARFHNVYGMHGSWRDGREKAPAALCRKVATAKRDGTGKISLWGDGTAVRSFCYIDDCVEGIVRLMESDFAQPLNIGSDEAVSIAGLLGHVEDVADYPVFVDHDTSMPQGVRGRNSDNTLCMRALYWVPSITLAEGIRKTYPWIEEQVKASCSKKEG